MRQTGESLNLFLRVSLLCYNGFFYRESLSFVEDRVKVGLANLGCSKNQVDAEVMLGFLATAGFSFTPDQNEADVIIVNTCGFIEASREESIDTLLDLAKMKEEGRCRLLIAAGCLTQRYGKELIGKCRKWMRLWEQGIFPGLGTSA
jgi:tRNA A37 methylthiotransferase MiaB